MREALRTNLQVKRAEWGGHREDGRIKVMAGMMDGDRKPPDVGCGGGGGGAGLVGEQSGRVIVMGA